jgi:class 3 adenylate cyclase
MAFDLGTPDQGCLLFADITGYTDYLAGTELMHAQDVLADLLETLVNSVQPTFKLSKLEGDAAFAYAESASLSPSMVMDTVETAYFSFRKRLRDITHSTTCECNACVLIPSLDLKFFIHQGEYVVREIAGSEELTGPDVILVQRLAKGTSGDVIGKPAFAVYTEKTLSKMAMDPTILGFAPHTETLSGIGDVQVFVQDLSVRWAFEQERHRDFVTSEQAIFEVEFETPSPPPVVWNHLTDPSKRIVWQSATTSLESVTGGRAGAGSINHCMHGPDLIIEHVSDWRPFSYITCRYDIGEDIEQWAWTTQLEETDKGTSVTIRLSDPGAEIWDAIGEQMIAQLGVDRDQLSEMLLGAMQTSS